MRLTAIIALFSLPCLVLAQTAPPQIKALNSYVDYTNQSAEEVARVTASLIEYYPSLDRKNWVPRYVCPVQPDEYYVNEAIKANKILGATGFPSATRAFQELKTAAEKIDEKCKALDTYHKLEDFKQDNFTKARSLIGDMQSLVKEYQIKQQSLRAELEKVYKKITSSTPDNAYRQVESRMMKAIAAERSVIDSWTYNLKESVHTGWDVERLKQSIPETEEQLASLKNYAPSLKYPASSMYPHFQESLGSILDSKRRGLDEYNFEAKKSDRHSNQLYLELINYFNGTLVADYNTFLQFSERDGYFGLKTINYTPVFEIRSENKKTDVSVQPFKDISRTPVQAKTQAGPITASVSSALSNYVEFINETWRQTRNLQQSLTNFNSTAAYFKNLETFERRAPMTFKHKDFQLPLSYYQKTISNSKSLSPDWQTSLNNQCEVLLNILKEMDELGASLETDVAEKKYEKDRLQKVYSILSRQAVLLNLWDEKKEILYQDVRAVFNAFPSKASSSWNTSGKVLRELADLDHDALFLAKAFYKGDSSITIPTEKIDQALRDVIAREFDNMKGIQKYGRNNGLCPYTPYEDIPETSRRLSDQLKNLKPNKKAASGYSHPYHSLVYLYNDIVEDYNKFSELAVTVYHLPSIFQPELFAVKYPDPKQKSTASQDQSKPKQETQEDNSSAQNKSPEPPVSITGKMNTVHDTVYIEKRDTIYLKEPNEDLRSMEGYATNNLVLLLDVSGSMNQPEKLPLLKQSVLNMLSMMRREDRITIIAFSGKPKILLKNTSFKEEESIKKSVSDLSSSGKTDGNAGIKLAYKVADENYIRAGNNRIILATDGEFVLNEATTTLIKEYADVDIFLSVFNFGKGMGSSKALEGVAKLGKGNYEVISKENVELKLIREAKSKQKK